MDWEQECVSHRTLICGTKIDEGVLRCLRQQETSTHSISHRQEQDIRDKGEWEDHSRKATLMDVVVKEMYRLFEQDDVDVQEVEKVLNAYKSNPRDWKKYAHFDDRNYTRNLVDTGNGKYNLIILCWGPGMCTNIHDHSGSHCFVKILQGDLLETKFIFPKDDEGIKPLEKIEEVRFGLNEVTYMSDELGLHRMENPSHSEPAVTLHLYIPAYDENRLFDQRTSQKHSSKVTFWSRYGKLDDKNDQPYDKIASCSSRQG